MTPITNDQIIKALNWRYATQAFDTSKQISPEDQDFLLEAIRLAPSSFGLQPWKVINVTDPALRAQIQEQAWGQPKITAAPLLFVLASKTEISPEYIGEFISETATAKGIPAESLGGLKNMVSGFVEGLGEEQVALWSAKQTYIPVGMVLTAAAMRGIDAGPMEGFAKEGVDKILGLTEMGLKSAVIILFGYRSAEDKGAMMPKFRFAKEKIVVTK